MKDRDTMMIDKESMEELLVHTKDVLKSYEDLRDTNILSIAFSKKEYEDYLILLAQLTEFYDELKQMIREEDFTNDYSVFYAGILVFDIIDVCIELHNDYGEEANLKVKDQEIDLDKADIVKFLSRMNLKSIADWQTLDEVSKSQQLFLTIQIKEQFAYFKSHTTKQEAYRYAISQGISKDYIFNRLL